MNNKILAILTTSVLTTSSALYAQEATTATPAAEAAATTEATAADALDEPAMKPTEGLSAKDQVEAQFDEFARQKDIVYGQAKDGVVYYKQVVKVKARPESPEFIKSRSLAFDEALVEIVKAFVKYEYGKNITETIDNLFEDDSSDIDEPTMSIQERSKGISKKIEALAEAKIDNALREEGVNPDEYKGKDIVEKRVIFAKYLTNKEITRAMGDASGLLVVNTFEGRGDDGSYAIGLIAKLSEENKAIMKAIHKSQRPNVAKKGVSVRAYLDAHAYTESFGTRLFFNEKSQPCLISYGQWGVSYTGNNERRKDRAEEHALSQSEEAANAYMTMALNMSMSLVSESERGQSEQSSNLFDSNGFPSEENLDAIIDKMSSEARATASAAMQGRGKALQRLIVHPITKQKVAVTAVVWTIDTLDAVENRRNPTAVKVAPANRPSVEKDPGVSSSGAMDSEYDW